MNSRGIAAFGSTSDSESGDDVERRDLQSECSSWHAKQVNHPKMKKGKKEK